MYRGQVARLVRVREENARRMQLLRTQLADAISGEQYEQAAILRDRIRELETGMEATAPLDLNTRNVHNASITSKEGN
jgi:protein-arginine kinase activator protein McsA